LENEATGLIPEIKEKMRQLEENIANRDQLEKEKEKVSERTSLGLGGSGYYMSCVSA
jgi:hypothetical protein